MKRTLKNSIHRVLENTIRTLTSVHQFNNYIISGLCINQLCASLCLPENAAVFFKKYIIHPCIFVLKLMNFMINNKTTQIIGVKNKNISTCLHDKYPALQCLTLTKEATVVHIYLFTLGVQYSDFFQTDWNGTLKYECRKVFFFLSCRLF